MGFDEAGLIEKLKAIEALFAGASTPGEKVAADRARDRILERLKESERLEPPVEFKFTMADSWSRRVLVALMRRYNIEPFRYRGQRHTTVMARAPRSFVDKTLWPEFQQLDNTLRSWLNDVTERVVSQVIHGDSSEAAEVPDQGRLGSGR